MTFRTVAGPGPPRCSRCCTPSFSLDRWTFTLLGFYLPFRALGGSLAPALACTSSLEIRSKVAPPPISAVCPLPGASSLRARGSTAWPCSAFVVSHHLDGLLHTSVCELVASHSRSGVHHVSCFPAPHPSRRMDAAPLALPAMQFVPSEVSPSPIAVLHHCSPCLPAVPPSPSSAKRASFLADADKNPYRLSRELAAPKLPARPSTTEVAKPC
jgi:hypothetical protein